MWKTAVRLRDALDDGSIVVRLDCDMRVSETLTKLFRKIGVRCRIFEPHLNRVFAPLYLGDHAAVVVAHQLTPDFSELVVNGAYQGLVILRFTPERTDLGLKLTAEDLAFTGALGEKGS